MSIITWISDEIHNLLNWTKAAEQKLAQPIAIAEAVLNALKAFDGSVAGQLVEHIIEATVPASTGLINAFSLQLPVWLIELNLIKSETGKTLTEQWEDALAYYNSITDPDVKASQMNTLKALFSKWFAVNQGVEATIQNMLTLSQITHKSVG